MKYLRLLFITAFTIVLFNGCTDNFEELNTQPDVLIADNLDVGLLGQAYAQSQWRGMFGAAGMFQIGENLFSDLWAQYFATTAANFDSDLHVEVGRWINSGWTNFYGAAAPQIKFVEDFTTENNLPVENALARLWRIQTYHRMTDYWGPIIYSNFGNGETTVPYDSQESIYRSFFPELDEIVSVLNANAGGTASFGNNDQIYNSNIDQWITFANSLRLRLAMRVKYVDPALSQAEAEKAVAAGVMTSNEDNAFILTTANSGNPFTTITAWGEFRMSALMESILKGYEDPRIGFYFSPAQSGDTDGDGVPYEGLRNGLEKVDKVASLNADNSDMATRWLPAGRGGINPPIQVMVAAEMYFLRAEGALEGWNMGGTAQELYEMGIETSMLQYTDATPEQISAYLASTNTPVGTGDAFDTQAASDIPVAFEAGADKERQLEQIITQKWIALYPDGWEAWAELRRTGYPRIIPRLNSLNPDVPADAIFRRQTFVTSEVANNNAAVLVARELPEIGGADQNNTRVWWDKKPQ